MRWECRNTNKLGVERMNVEITMNQVVTIVFGKILEQEFLYRSTGHSVVLVCPDKALFKDLSDYVVSLMHETGTTCRPSMRKRNRWMTAIKARVTVFEAEIRTDSIKITMVE